MAADGQGDSTWDRLRAVRRSGRLRGMSELEAKVYAVLVEHSDSRTGLVRLSAERIALGEPEWPLGGVCTNVSRVRRALAGLVDLGAIVQEEHGGGRGSVAQYRLLLPELMPLFDPSAAERGTRTVPDSAGAAGAVKGDAVRPKQGRFAPRKGDAQRPQTGTPSVPRISYSPNSPPPPRAVPPEKTGTASVPLYMDSGSAHGGGGGAGGGGGGAGRQAEEEGFYKDLVNRGLRRETAQKFCRQIPRAEADAIWREVVDDKNVKSRKSVYFCRLRDFLQARDLDVTPNPPKEQK